MRSSMLKVSASPAVMLPILQTLPDLSKLPTASIDAPEYKEVLSSLPFTKVRKTGYHAVTFERPSM
jgi:hypothetical protein